MEILEFSNNKKAKRVRNYTKKIFVIIVSFSIILVLNLTAKTFKISEIRKRSLGEAIIKIDGGSENNIKLNDRGRIYYYKKFGGVSVKAHIAKFVVTRIDRYEAIIEIIEKSENEEVEVNHLVEFDIPPSGTLIIKSNTNKADVFLNNEKTPKGRVESRIKLAQGEYIARVKEGNRESKRKIKIVSGETALVTIDLPAEPLPNGIMQINSNPEGAEIYLDDKKYPEGKTPFKKSLSPRKYKVIIKMEGREEIAEELNIIPGEKISRTYNLPLNTPTDGVLEIITDPIGAEVYINNRKNPDGKSPFQKSYPPGTYKIKIIMQGMIEEEREIEVKAGKITKKIIALTPKPLQTFTVRINTEPEGARVLINEEEIGLSPIEVELTESKINIKIMMENYDTIQDFLNLSQPNIEKDYTLKKNIFSLKVSTNPPEADLFINDNYIGRTPLERSFSRGQYKIKIEKKGYKRKEDDISIENSNVNNVYNLEPLGKGKFKISAHPYAEVEVDGNPICKPGEVVPPVKIWEVEEGTHTIKFILKGYYDKPVEAELKEYIREGELKKVHYDFERHLVQQSVYEITAFPKVKIDIDDKIIGTAPTRKKIPVKEGQHRLKFSLDNFEDNIEIELDDTIKKFETRKIHVRSEEFEIQDFSSHQLEKKEIYEDLYIIRANLNVKVEIDGKFSGAISSLHELEAKETEGKKHKIKMILGKFGINGKVEIVVYKLNKKKYFKIGLNINSE